MRIAQVAPPLESVPPVRYGGTERVVATLTEELVQRGHEITLFASGDSRSSARLVPVVEQSLWHCEPPYKDLVPFWAITLGRLAEQVGEFDIVHSHLDYWGFPLARLAPCPVVTTLHGRLDRPELQPLYREFREAPVVSISNAQRRPIPHANWVATVYHGIPLDEFTFNARPQGYLAFIGRIAPEKGLDIAIEIARQAGLPLKIAARMPLPFTQDPEVKKDWEYYRQVIEPLLQQDRNLEFVGEVGGRDKDALLGNAAALLFPIRWPEPFGLVMAEALACGTPVLALDHGSVPEVLQDGLTGFVRKTTEELVQAVARISELDRAHCRAEAERRFSPQAMARAYEQVYADLVADRIAQTLAPHFVPRATRNGAPDYAEATPRMIASSTPSSN